MKWQFRYLQIAATFSPIWTARQAEVSFAACGVERRTSSNVLRLSFCITECERISYLYAGTDRSHQVVHDTIRKRFVDLLIQMYARLI